MTAAIGLRAHTGWAIVMTLEVDSRQPRILDRRRISLQADDIPPQFYHVAHSLDPDSGGHLISQALEASVEVAERGIKATIAELGGGIDHAGVVIGRAPPATPHRHARLSHAGLHWAEGEAYRWTLLQAAGQLGLQVTMVAESDLGEMAERLGMTPAEVAAYLKRLGTAIGPPWTQREKSAAMAAWLAMARS